MKSWPAAGLGLGNGMPGIQPAAASEPRLSLWSWGGGGAQGIQKVQRGHTTSLARKQPSLVALYKWASLHCSLYLRTIFGSPVP